MSKTRDPERRQQWQAFVERLNPQTDPLALRLLDEMRMVSHALMQTSRDSLAHSGLSYAQFRILMGLLVAEEIDGEPTLNPSELSVQQGTSRNAISGLIRSLEEDRLIERHLDQRDRRKFNISLSPAGREKVQTHFAQHTLIVGRIFEALSVEERQTLSHLLHKLGDQADLAREAASGAASPAEATSHQE